MADLEAVLAAGQQLGSAKSATGDYAVIPAHSQVRDLESFQARPRRIRAAVEADETPSFSAYFNRFKSPASVIFADQSETALFGIIDYHQIDTPAFGDHRVTYRAPKSKEWEAWVGSSGKVMPQTAFAQFIENNVVDIRTPNGADVLEVSRSLQAKKSVDFGSSIRLADGQQQFIYSEVVEGTTRKGDIKVPEEFTLGIPVFIGGPLYEVVARLRYRIAEAKLTLWYELYRPDHIVRHAFGEIVALVKQETTTEIWMGAPETA